ncbi:MAG: hypothetical protein HUJ98_10525 [Bacteroidaceae bacterium]|nr:hypothetical protein [Bacteroidaceae bacterium]
MKRIFLSLLFTCVASLSFAQHFSPKDYQKRFEAYVTKEAGLTKEEAARFFPLYREMQEKQRVYYHEMRQITHKTNTQHTSESEFRKLNDKICELNINTHKMETAYLSKFRKIISDKKYFMVRKAEESFQHRELHRNQNGKKK